MQPDHAEIPISTTRGRRWQRRTASWLAPIVLIGGALMLVRWSVVNGRELQRTQRGLYLGAAPLVGEDADDGWDWRWSWRVLGAVAVAALLLVTVVRGWLEALRLRVLIIVSAAASTAFSISLAAVDGKHGLLRGANHPTEYLANLAKAPPAATFVRNFLRDINGYSVHVRGHPPGFLLVLKAMDFVGLDGAWPVVALSALGVAMTVAGVLTTVWVLAGRTWVERAAPWLIVAPSGIWMMTSGDAFFTGVAATGTALLAVSMSERRRIIRIATGIAAGSLLGALLFLTYLGATFGVVPAAVTIAMFIRRRGAILGGLFSALVCVAAVVGAFALAGFWWWDGVEATKLQYAYGTAQFRPWSYFRWGNLGAAAFALGPVIIAALGSTRQRTLWWLIGAGLIALAASHASTYTKAEVERIWLLFFPWITLAGAAFPLSRRRTTSVLFVLHAACAIVLQLALVTKW